MTKKLFDLFFIFMLPLLFSCNNNDKKSTPDFNNNSVEQQLKNELERYPDSLAITQKLIQLYIDSSRYEDAIKITDDAIKKDSGNGELWEIKGSLHYQNGDTLGAIKAFETAIDIFPLPDYMISLGSLYAQTKDQRALLLADEILAGQREKSTVDAYYIKGIYYTYTGDKIKAVSYFDKCISIDYNYVYAYREKGIAFYDMGKYNEALQVLNKAVTVQNTFDEGYYWLGRCYQKLNRKDEAIQNYKTALLFDKNFVEAREALDSLENK